jgi:hypothetical protein
MERGAGGGVFFLAVLAQPVKAMRDAKKTEVAIKKRIEFNG